MGAVLESTELAGKADSDEFTSDLAEVNAQGSSTFANSFPEQEEGPRVNGLTQEYRFDKDSAGHNFLHNLDSMIGHVGATLGLLILGSIFMCISCCVKA